MKVTRCHAHPCHLLRTVGVCHQRDHLGVQQNPNAALLHSRGQAAGEVRTGALPVIRRDLDGEWSMGWAMADGVVQGMSRPGGGGRGQRVCDLFPLTERAEAGLAPARLLPSRTQLHGDAGGRS